MPNEVVPTDPVDFSFVDSAAPISQVAAVAISISGFSVNSFITSQIFAIAVRAVALLGNGYVSDIFVFAVKIVIFLIPSNSHVCRGSSNCGM